ncbi:hypothetical protein OH720_00640 [Pseudomonas sp. WJP1]|uniref:RHS repeat-associated core domain-containing protein n=1 Tax=Pseudomonas sp. WJP1 TaxID=2986947 RepID=UPI00234A12DF|nr:RHS repeat-associated core domain-containing protein [Pseudomonas sp. WJP1]WCM51554.1 hypothetical protein OH720_00640 [Pseudomonas sp. WJP1]
MTQLKPVDQETSSWQRTTLLATDNSLSIIGEIFDGKHNPIAYTAYGEQSAQQEDRIRLGFNGQLREPKIGWYLLGNGYRAYNPRLMRFHSPDSWSPFGGGGFNAYMYCMGNPVNHSDPTGHVVQSLLAAFNNLIEATRDVFFRTYRTQGTLGLAPNADLALFSNALNRRNSALVSSMFPSRTAPRPAERLAQAYRPTARVTPTVRQPMANTNPTPSGSSAQRSVRPDRPIESDAMRASAPRPARPDRPIESDAMRASAPRPVRPDRPIESDADLALANSSIRRRSV